MAECRKTGGDCQSVIDKWKEISDKQSQQLDETLKNNPAEALAWDKESAEGGLAGNNTAAAGTGAQAGKNAADNNALAIVAGGYSAAAGSGVVAVAVGQRTQYQVNNTTDDLDMAGSCEGTRKQCAAHLVLGGIKMIT